MIKNNYRYTKTVVLGEQFLKDTGNKYRVVSKKKYKGKIANDGKVILEAGVTFTLQILEDNSEIIVDRETGEIKEDIVFETFEVTVIGLEYPSNFKKGDYVSLGAFLSDASYFVNYTLIMRFADITYANK